MELAWQPKDVAVHVILSHLLTSTEDKNHKKMIHKISIIIVNYNTTKLLIDSINSIKETTKDIPLQIFVVDNCSNDMDVEKFRRDFPGIQLILNRENKGFARANNQALENFDGGFALLLNPDTIVKSGAIKRLRAFMEENPSVGIAGPKLLYPDGSVQHSWEKNFPGYKYAGKSLESLPPDGVAWIMGACMMVRKEAIDEVGALDEDYFMYGEETDWCLRMRKKGWKIAYIPEAEVVHFEARSASTLAKEETWRRRILSEFLFYGKHYPPFSTTMLRMQKIMKALWRMPFLYLAAMLKPGDVERGNKLVKYKVILKVLLRKG